MTDSKAKAGRSELEAGSDLERAAASTRVVLEAVDQLEANGWARAESLPTFSLSNSVSGGPGAQLVSAVADLEPLLTAARLRCDWGSDYIVLELAGQSPRSLLMTEQSHGPLSGTFPAHEIAEAEAAFGGDVAAAAHLSGEWSGTLNVDPARQLAGAATDHKWLVVKDAAAVRALIMQRPWWELGLLMPADRRQTIAVQSAAESLDVRTSTQRICSLNADLSTETGRTTPSPEEQLYRWSSKSVPSGTADPPALHPVSIAGAHSDTEPILDALRSQSTACCWALLATEVTIVNRQASIEFFGLQRQTWLLGPTGPALSEKEYGATFDLWKACAQSPSPDRILAVRQVVSLYREAPWAMAADVAMSAEPVFVALRSTATTEALRTQREARALALSVARQTAESTTQLAKNAVERSLAVLGAIGALIIARTAKTLTATQALNLRHLLAIYLLVMVPWSFLIEGRPVTSGISALKEDIGTFSDFLTPAEQAAILAAATVSRARQQAWIARVVVPLAYAAAALVAVLV